jgi:monoamine oxidase
MDRRDFLRGVMAAGMAPAAASAFATACGGPQIGRLWDFNVTFDGEVVVIGAGAAGLGAGYLLDRYGVPFTVFEAAPVIGGRTRRLEGFADFPIDLGAEWIHEDPQVLAELIDDDEASGSVDVVPYSPDRVSFVNDDGEAVRLNAGGNYYSEYKFKRGTWHGFLETHFAQRFEDRIRTSAPVVSVDHSGERVRITLLDGEVIEADAVVVTVPIKILQRGDIAFTPALSDSRTADIDAIDVPDGLKVFLEFKERFYPDMFLTAGALEALSYERLFYDAAFRKESDRHVLAMFCVGGVATRYVEMADDQAIIDDIVAELDGLYDGAASAQLKQAVVQNWSAEPYIRGAYSYEYKGDEQAIKRRLRAPVDGRLFFAGEALSAWNSSTVPGAMQSAYQAVQTLLEGG